MGLCTSNRIGNGKRDRTSRVRRRRGGLTPQVVMMVKEPAAGRVKTRLAKGIGAGAATAFYRHATRSSLSRVTRPREWRTVVAVAPDAAIASRAWPQTLPRLKQGGGDLGQRMQRVLDRLPPGPVLIIGSDVPGLTASHIRAGLRALGASDAVLGPADDGGYWLIGLRRRPRIPRAFARVRWSTEHALADTRRNLAGLKVATVDTLADVDEAKDLLTLGRQIGRRIAPV